MQLKDSARVAPVVCERRQELLVDTEVFASAHVPEAHLLVPRERVACTKFVSLHNLCNSQSIVIHAILSDTNGAAHRRVNSSRIQVASTRWPTWAGGRCAGRAGPLAESADALHIDVRDSIHVHVVATIWLISRLGEGEGAYRSQRPARRRVPQPPRTPRGLCGRTEHNRRPTNGGIMLVIRCIWAG